MTTEASRLAQLPGFDTAPDVYETPEIDDSTTTATASTLASPRGAPSEESDTSAEDEDEGYGVSRRRLYPKRARDQFKSQSRGVDAKGVDLSDRVGRKKRGYKLKRAAHDDDEEDDESLQGRLARLRREVEECRALAEAEKHAETDDDEGEGEGESTLEDVDALSRLLAGIDVSPANARNGRRRRGSIFHDAPTDATIEAANLTDEQTLNRISAFDGRLAALESALGISSVLENPETLSQPLLPSLGLLDNQLAALTSATSLTSLEAASSRINKLKAEAQQLQKLQLEAKESDGEDAQTSTLLSSDDMKKLQTLYALLPNLQALAPTVPALIARLRTLRTLHTSAANASEDLDAIQQRQSEMDKELKLWREGLEKVEQAMVHAGEANGRNGKTVQSWVEDLDKRMKALGR